MSTLTWRQALAFDADVDDHVVALDGPEAFGGEGYGPRPKVLLLTALAGCTAMDVISILNKMRLEVESFEVEARGTLADEHPKVYTHITLTYRLSGDLPEKKVLRAVDLSENKYCPVSAMLRATVPIERVVQIDGRVVA